MADINIKKLIILTQTHVHTRAAKHEGLRVSPQIKSRAVNTQTALQRSAVSQRSRLRTRRSDLHERQQARPPARRRRLRPEEFVSLFSSTWIMILHHEGHEYVEQG